MPWSGKLVGGLIGGMLGGPVGAGLGASVGHVLRDGNRPLELLRLDWQHHAFRASGPGMVLTPAWGARGLAGEEVRVRVRVHELVHRAPLTPETDDENVGRRAASGTIAAPAAKCHLLGVALGVALGSTLGGSLGRCAFASFTLGCAVFH